MTKPDSHGVTGPYAHPPCGWERLLEEAQKHPTIKRFADNYRLSRHPACLNAMMQNAPADFWLVYYSKPNAR